MNLNFINDQELAVIRQKQQAGKALIVDVRSAAEYSAEHIPGSRNIPLESFNAAELAQVPYEIILFHCKSGMRTKQNAQKLASTEGHQLFCLSGGIEQWKKAGLPTIRNAKAPLDIMRQVQIIAGSLLVFFSVLALLVSAAFIWGTLLIGAGLAFAGATGFCGLAKALMWLPYNRRGQNIKSSCSSDDTQHGCCG